MRTERLWFVGLIVVAALAALGTQALIGGATGGSAPTGAGERLAAAAPVGPSPTVPASVGTASTLAASGAPTTPTSRPLATAAPSATPTPLPSPTATPAPPTPTPASAAAPVKTGNAPAPAVNAYAVVVIDEASGQVLYERNSHQRVAPASITKIVTAIVALDHADPKVRVRTSFDPAELVDSTLMGLRVGDELTLEDLLYGLMLPSGNDAALAIASYVGGSRAHFVEMMNDKARELGMKDSHFQNPHGLDADGHYTSAYDITMAARYGMRRYPLFVRLVSARVWTVQSSRGPYEVYNLNRFLANYQGADGVKIGYTENAGRTIVASATRNGHRVYVGLMHVGDTVTDTIPLMNWAFNNFTWPSQ